jgi:hypothetical protein
MGAVSPCPEGFSQSRLEDPGISCISVVLEMFAMDNPYLVAHQTY